MINELVRMTADWLKDTSDHGVNVMLQSLPIDSEDEAPPLLAIEADDNAAVYDSTRHEWVRSRKDPPSLPCLYIISDGSFDMHGEEMTGNYVDSRSPSIIAIRYLAEKSNLEKGTTDGQYTLRAVRQSIRRLFLQADDSPYRTRNGICIMNLARTTYYPVVETIGNSAVSGALAVHYDVRDSLP